MTLSDNSASIPFEALQTTQSCTVDFQGSESQGHRHTTVVNDLVITIDSPFTIITITSKDANNHDNKDAVLKSLDSLSIASLLDC
jgi:hypothetical protein